MKKKASVEIITEAIPAMAGDPSKSAVAGSFLKDSCGSPKTGLK